MSSSEYLYEREPVETELGPTLAPSPMESLLRVAELGGGEVCPRCGHQGKLFFGNPNAAYWCAACQIAKDLGLTMVSKDGRRLQGS